jgi:hypothetical protein
MTNCIIDGKQCTIARYVDNTKISHLDPIVVSSVINKIEAAFDKMTVTRGKDHTFCVCMFVSLTTGPSSR